MLSSSLRAFLFRTATVTDRVSAGLLILVLVALRWTPQTPLWSWFDWLFRWVQANGPGLVLVLALLTAVSRLKRFLMPPVTARLIHEILTQHQKLLFPDDDELSHEHRVTLFLKKNWVWRWRRWPWAGWLVPVERSGAMTRKSKTCFKAVANNPTKCEGIAGSTWMKQGRTVAIEDLPDLNDPVEPAAEALIREYARKTLVSPEWVKKRLKKGGILARSYYGHPVELNGTIVGVIVVDSRNPKTKTTKKYMHSYALMANLLSKVLEKGVNLDH